MNIFLDSDKCLEINVLKENVFKFGVFLCELVIVLSIFCDGDKCLEINVLILLRNKSFTKKGRLELCELVLFWMYLDNDIVLSVNVWKIVV